MTAIDREALARLIEDLRQMAGQWSVPPHVDPHPRGLMLKAAEAIEGLTRRPMPSREQVRATVREFMPGADGECDSGVITDAVLALFEKGAEG